jgi:hypothetical protein
MRLLKRIKERFLFERHWRCQEPVVVIESDDWGLERKPCHSLLANAGELSDWAFERTETSEDLEKLFEVLARRPDRYGRPACMTANFVMSNPDYEAIESSGFRDYHHVPLDVSCPPERKAKYADGLAKAAFVPQYHGLRHFHPAPLLTDLASDAPRARDLFGFGAATGLAMVKGHLWRYHSEYQHCRAAQLDSSETIRSTLDVGLAAFERFFGFRSESTIPPHYLVPESLPSALQQAGIAFLQGANYQMRDAEGRRTVSSGALGSKCGGLVLLSRNTKLEPRPGRRESVEQALEAAHYLFDSHVPVILDTHRINYTGQFREDSLKALDSWLSGIAPRNPIFLSSPELGAAIRDGGRYVDVLDRSVKRLTPRTGWTGGLRRMGSPQ